MATPQAALELDLFAAPKQPSSAAPTLDRRRSFRGMQSAISKINPQLVKSVIASASADEQFPLLALPLSAPAFRSKAGTAEEIAPMTIFHNGMVTVFDVTKDQAESILKMARGVSSKNVEADKAVASSSSASFNYQGEEGHQEGLPVARRKSLERFFEKRKERLMSVCPYEISIKKLKDEAAAAAGAGIGFELHQFEI